MPTSLGQIINLDRYFITQGPFQRDCRSILESSGCLELPSFLTDSAVASIQREAQSKQQLAYYCTQQHNVYLSPADPTFDKDHPRNRTVVSSKGCITDDQISADSALRGLYDADQFRRFLCAVLNEDELFPYADPLSSINVHYARPGQQLGWHFDNSEFAITLMIQPPSGGGRFEYVRGVRDSATHEMNFDEVQRILNGQRQVESIFMAAGTLLLFRGRDALHRVTPVAGDDTRILAVLAYNGQPGIALSESARKTFYGRLS